MEGRVYAMFYYSVVLCATGKYAYSSEVSPGYQLMDDFGFSLEGADYLLFEVRSCADVKLLLMHNKTNYQTELYEITIVSVQLTSQECLAINLRNNSGSDIRKDRSRLTAATLKQVSMESKTIRTFWVTWEGNYIHVGSGIVVGDDEFMAYNDSMPIDVKQVAVSPGDWMFYSSNCKCCYHKPRYCQGLQESGISESGIYSLTGIVSDEEVDIYCDMETDGGGWLVFQRRMDGSEDFYRGWIDYENGFGDLAGEFWLGNRCLSTILSDGHYELRIDLEDFEGNKRHAQYQTFMIGTSLKNYKLTVCGYSGDAGDSFSSHSGMEFTTKDRDNDLQVPYNCAEPFKGAWWYMHCHASNLNGLYLRGNHSSYADGVNWTKWRGLNYSLKTTEMKIREICKV